MSGPMELASLAQLERSHRRHDEVMAGLLDAARRLAAGRAEDADLVAIHSAVEYFVRSVPRHFLDEEGSVFPRLSTRRPQLAEALAALSAEHPTQIALQGEVAAAARDLHSDTRPGAAMALLDAATRLAAIHRAHVDREDRLFADAHAALTAEDDTEIAAEMETRRYRDDRDPSRPRGGRRRRETELLTPNETLAIMASLPVAKPAVVVKPAIVAPKVKAKAKTKAKAKAKAKAKKAAPNRAAPKKKAALKKAAAKSKSKKRG